MLCGENQALCDSAGTPTDALGSVPRSAPVCLYPMQSHA